jgi:D-3-phosphoglycerate dehydrogenase / 2-oxoglutarate reductase
MSDRNEFQYKVVLIDYSPELFFPMGFEAEMLAEIGASWEVHRCTTGEQVVAVAKDADVVAVQSVRPLLTREVLAQLDRCRCTIRAGAGYDSIDYKAATEMGIMVCNAPTYCTDDVADHAIGLMLAAVRNIPRLDAAMRQGSYARQLARPSRRLAGTTLGIIGLGRIGGTTARRVRGWEMTVLAHDPYVSQDRADEVGAQMVPLDELLARSEFISIHCLLNDETYHMLSWDEFAAMKEGVILVNTARGPIVDEEAMVAALREGRLWAAGLDVTEQEPLPPDSPLLTMDNVLLTPHISANTPESQRDLYRLICEISADVVQGRIPEWLVNPEALDHLKPAP